LLAIALSNPYNAMMGRKCFSDQVRDAVNQSGISRYRICAEIKLSQPAMCRFMAGKGGLSMEVLERLFALLDLNVVAGRKRRGD
jgi:hypothetical protein